MASGHSVTLNSGQKMDVVGLGTWKSKPGEVQLAVEAAIDSGYRHIDCAWAYQNETEVGAAIKVKIDEGVVERKDLFITSKLWQCFHEPSMVKKALKQTLDALKLDCLDLYLVHNPVAYKYIEGNPFPLDENGKCQNTDLDYMETWKEMEKMKEEGLTKNIGVSNFNQYQLGRVIREGRIKPAVNQIEINPYLTQEGMASFCKKNKVIVTAYAPFGSPDNPWLKEDYKPLLEDKVLHEIAKRLNVTAAQVVIRYLIQRGFTVIPKSVTPSRIQSNYQVFDFKLGDADMKKLTALNKNYRTCLFEWDKGNKYYPFAENYSESVSL